MGKGLLQRVFDAAPTAMIMVTFDGFVRMANREAERLFGFEVGGLEGRSVEDLVPAEQRRLHRAQRMAYLAQPVIRAMGAGRDLFGLRRDGSQVPIEIGLNPIETSEGSFVLAAIVDLTQRKAMEDSLRRSEEHLRRIVDAAPNAMLMVAADGRILLANAGAESLFGWSRAELLGRAVELLVPDAARLRHPGLRQAFFSSPSRRPMGAGRDLHGLRKDGSEVPIEIGLNPIQTAEGHCVLAAVIDITHRKQAEDRLRDALAEKETLLREIHHRVKNNMQIVSSMLSLQTGHTEDPGTRRLFEECRGRVRSMALIHEKLYLGEKLAVIDFGEYAADLASMLLQSYAPEGNVRLRTACDHIALDIDTAVSLGLILNEFVTNALKHGFPAQRRGEVSISLRITGDMVELCVEDDGVGLPAQFDAQSAKSLGLRIIRSLARQIDGTLVIAEGGRPRFGIAFPQPLAVSHERP